MKRFLSIIYIIILFTGCESLTPKSHHETGLHPEVQGHINRQKANDISEIMDIGFDIVEIMVN